MSKTCSIITIVFIWIASMLLASPCLLYSTTITNRYRGKEMTGCILVWPDGKVVGSDFDFVVECLSADMVQTNSLDPYLFLKFRSEYKHEEVKWISGLNSVAYLYQMLFLFITYLVPIILMTMCYTMMGRVLWGSRSIGEMTQRQIDSIRSKRKVVKMFILIVAIFGICWLPYHIYFLYVYYDPNIIFNKYTQHIYLCFYWFAMSNAMVNPLIYYWMNARFRQYFRTAMCGWKMCCSTDSQSESTLSRPMLERKPYPKFDKQAVPEARSCPEMTHVCNGNFNLNQRTSFSKGDFGNRKKRRMWLQESFRRQSIQTTVNL